MNCLARGRELGVRRVLSPGAVAHSEVPDFIAAMDLAALPPADESFHYSPLKLKEFWAAGVPTVVPAIGEMRRTLVHQESAFLYDNTDRGLAEALMESALAPDLRHVVGEGARRLLLEKYTMVQQVAKLLQAIDGLGGQR